MDKLPTREEVVRFRREVIGAYRACQVGPAVIEDLESVCDWLDAAISRVVELQAAPAGERTERVEYSHPGASPRATKQRTVTTYTGPWEDVPEGEA